MLAPIRILSVSLLFLAVVPRGIAHATSGDVPTQEGIWLGPALVAEFELQSGQVGDAARLYLQAAHSQPDDVGLVEHAARIAMLAGDDAGAERAVALWHVRSPKSLSIRAIEASIAMRRQQLDAARRVLSGLLRDADPRGWRYALIVLTNGGRDPQMSARLLEELVRRGDIPNRIDVWQEFGRLALRLGQPPLVKSIIDQFVARFPKEPRVALLQAAQLHEEGKYHQALSKLKWVERRAVADVELRGVLALTYEGMGENHAAARVLANGPQDVETYGLRASLLARQQDRQALLALYEELSDSGRARISDPERRLLLGKIAEFLRRYNDAIAWYHGVLDGDLRGEAVSRAVSVLFELKRYDDAFDEVHRLQGDAAIEDGQRRDAYLLEAGLKQRLGDAAGELSAFARGLDEFPNDTELLYTRSLAWERRDDIVRAEVDLRQLLVVDPGNVMALNALGYTLANHTTRYNEALALVERARTAEPDNPTIIDSYGWVMYRLGRVKEALVELKRAWSLAKDAEIAVHVAEVLWVDGQREEARYYFGEARKLDPDNLALRDALKKFGL
ncbi:MAG TPA: tetratricopeptide repeat protein [Xylella sp.]